MGNYICLVIIYNHRYDNNIEILEQIYKNRFAAIYHLVPFYDGKNHNVIPVYESSYQFQGYVAQGMKYFYSDNYTQYLFIGDDLLLNPDINQNNLLNILGISNTDSYIPETCPLGKCLLWNYKVRHFDAFRAFHEYTGTNYKNEIMARNEAFEKIAKLNYIEDDFKLEYKQLFNGIMNKTELLEFIIQHPKHLLKLFRGIEMPYPFFGGYSDLFVLHRDDLVKTAKVFGIFAAINLFAEIAIPTAMELNCKNLKKQNEKSGSKILWEEAEKKQLELEYSNSLTKLFNNWPANCNYIHPVKLSRWLY